MLQRLTPMVDCRRWSPCPWPMPGQPGIGCELSCRYSAACSGDRPRQKEAQALSSEKVAETKNQVPSTMHDCAHCLAAPTARTCSAEPGRPWTTDPQCPIGSRRGTEGVTDALGQHFRKAVKRKIVEPGNDQCVGRFFIHCCSLQSLRRNRTDFPLGRQARISPGQWRRWASNPHGRSCPEDFKSSASAVEHRPTEIATAWHM